MQNKAFWRQIGMDNNDVIAVLEKQEELVFTPGSKYSYSNSGYTILTKIIEKVTGEKFNDYSTAFFFTGAAIALGLLLMAANYKAPSDDSGSMLIE